MNFAIFTESEMRPKPVSNQLSISSKVRPQSVITVFLWVSFREENKMRHVMNAYITFFTFYFEFLAIESSAISWSYFFKLFFW